VRLVRLVLVAVVLGLAVVVCVGWSLTVMPVT
jgi:hypothetical protein